MKRTLVRTCLDCKSTLILVQFLIPFSVFILFTVCDIFGEDSKLMAAPSERDGSGNTVLTLDDHGQQRPRRFFSSILGGDIPYGSRGHILTPGARKAYPPSLLPPPKVSAETEVRDKPLIRDTDKDIPANETPINLSAQGQQGPNRARTPKASVSVPVVRCSVIQRTPSTHNKESDEDQQQVELPRSSIHVVEPEQEQPIDYHIHKRRDDKYEERERKSREARRSAIISRPVINFRNLPPSMLRHVSGIMAAAAGHGRSSSNGGNGNTSNGGQHSSGGGFAGTTNNGSAGNSGAGGAMGGSGSGGGMGGRDGRSNYGPNSPPTGSLPPFYESLKGGTGINGFNANNGSFLGNSYTSLVNAATGMDCENNPNASGEITNIGGYSDQNSGKQFSMLQNSFGIALKDEQDLDGYESKMDPLTLNQYSGYDLNEQMMVEMAGVNVSDPIQFSATFAFTGAQGSDQHLLDSLSDAVDLSQLLQRLPNDDQSSASGNEIDLASTPSISPESINHNDNHPIEPFSDHLITRGSHGHAVQMAFDQQNGRMFPNGGKTYMDHPPPSYASRNSLELSHHHANNGGIPINPSVNSDQQLVVPDYIDSHSNLSLPSPGTSSSLDENHTNQLLAPSTTAIASTIQNVSEKDMKRKVKTLTQRVSASLIKSMMF